MSACSTCGALDPAVAAWSAGCRPGCDADQGRLIRDHLAAIEHKVDRLLQLVAAGAAVRWSE